LAAAGELVSAAGGESAISMLADIEQIVAA
jgi:hypothetical protein